MTMVPKPAVVGKFGVIPVVFPPVIAGWLHPLSDQLPPAVPLNVLQLTAFAPLAHAVPERHNRGEHERKDQGWKYQEPS